MEPGILQEMGREIAGNRTGPARIGGKGGSFLNDTERRIAYLFIPGIRYKRILTAGPYWIRTEEVYHFPGNMVLRVLCGNGKIKKI